MEHLATQIAAAINMRALYPANHPRVVQTIEQIVAGLNRSLQQTKADSVTYLIVGDDLVAGQDVMRKTSLSVRQFIEVMKRRGIERLTLAAGLQQDETHQLVGALASGDAVVSSPHIIPGRVQVTLPLTVMNKPGKLEGEEWETMKGHAQQGAWYLSEVEGSSPLAVVVAFEHHLRYDGQPNYPVLRSPRVPNLASRMTSIADTYDAMSTVRPYQQPLARAAAFEILKKRSETFYDPLLVGNFIRLVSET